MGLAYKIAPLKHSLAGTLLVVVVKMRLAGVIYGVFY